MEQIGRDIVAIFSAIVGLAILAVLVQSQNTGSVITDSTSGFAKVLHAAMNVNGN